MRLIASIFVSLVCTYAALILAIENIDAISSIVCSNDMTLLGVACRVGGGIVTILLVPTTGVLAFIAVWSAFAK
jgi:hypothetical protein